MFSEIIRPPRYFVKSINSFCQFSTSRKNNIRFFHITRYLVLCNSTNFVDSACKQEQSFFYYLQTELRFINQV
ncbi:hypothetical protein WN51_09244 [Melipona quadrifasciata]|uniref:Uncharacterized protein n=1 Tax=Melipona quadrifasciata TaxID=166423 RepID=A0A0M9A5D7_9HYME|nr:hypothetical protein WN51_09244 [Melipona quadrifasciata]